MKAIVYSLLGVSFFLFGEVAQAQTVVKKTSRNKSSQYYKSPEKASAKTKSKAEISIAEINERLNAIEEPAAPKTIASKEKCYLTEQILNVASDYKGTRYVWGGMSRSGMDCSGFVKTAFDMFDINLPRTSREMSKKGEKINKTEAKPGDLIFFKNGGSRVINHVGIVIEVDGDEIKFIHSASSKGVSINSLNENYYRRNFTQINRIYDRNSI